jgi:hypothetical protein
MITLTYSFTKQDHLRQLTNGLAYQRVRKFTLKRIESFTEAGSLEWSLLAFPANIRLGWKRLTVGKHSSLLRYINSYSCKKFSNAGP